MAGKLKLLLIGFSVPILIAAPVYATTTYSSPSYSVQQIFFGAGGNLNESSPNYKSQVTVGETGIGNYNGSNFQAYSGYNTNADPFLQIVVTGENLNLGVLSKSSTAIANGTFFVRAWNSSGYIIQTSGLPPTNSGYSMATNSTPTSSTIGTEQFGMNLVANTVPAGFIGTSADPQQTTAYAYGTVATNYATTNKYAYTNYDIIASSNKATSSTIYTISYIFNISGSTPGGQYVFTQSLVATGYY